MSSRARIQSSAIEEEEDIVTIDNSDDANKDEPMTPYMSHTAATTALHSSSSPPPSSSRPGTAVAQDQNHDQEISSNGYHKPLNDVGYTTQTSTSSDATTKLDPHHPHHQQEQPTPLQIHYYGLALVFLAPALGGFLYGYDIGASSFVLSMILADRNHDNWWHNFPKLHQGLFVSALALGALIGSHIVLVYLTDSIGRRKEIRIAATLFIVGTMFNVMSGTVLATTGTYGGEDSRFNFGIGLVTLLSGRLLYGAGVGFIMHSAPAYMAEMSPSKVRGAIVSAKETVIVFGIIVGMLMGDLQSDYPDNWYDLYGYSILFAVPMLLLTFKIPRSKRWLLMKGYRDEAKESMQFVYKGNVNDEFERMADTINNMCCREDSAEDEVEIDQCDSFFGDESKKGGSIDNQEAFPDDENIDDDINDDKPQGMLSYKYRGIMFIGMGLLIAQQYSGQPCVLAYSRVLFEAAGWHGHTSVITVTMMGIVSSFTVSMVDRLGRKTLLAAGSAIMLISISCLAYGFWGWDEDAHEKLSNTRKQVVLWSMFVFISGYQIGFGPITWTVLSEIYPTEIRGSAMALSVEVNFLSKFLTQLFFPIVQGILGWGTTFVVFGCIILAGLIFVIVQVPETKGMTLEEIQMKLKRSNSSMAGRNEGFNAFNLRSWFMGRSSPKAAVSPLLSESSDDSPPHLVGKGESRIAQLSSLNDKSEMV